MLTVFLIIIGAGLLGLIGMALNPVPPPWKGDNGRGVSKSPAPAQRAPRGWERVWRWLNGG